MIDVLNLIEHYRNKNRLLIFAVNIILVFILGFIDFYNGHEIIFSIFYLVIISISVVFTNITLSIIISLLAAFVGLSVDLSYSQQYTSVIYPIINNTFRLFYYIVHTLLLSKLLYLYQKSRELSLIDPLTKINNSRSFQIQFQHEIDKSKRTKLPLSLVYFDIDNFKFINDNYGHSTGDILLQTITSRILKIIRPMDVFARLGGDEFTLLLPETDIENAKTAVKRLQSEVLNIAINNKWPITLSIGVVIFKETTLVIDEMIKIADELMYQVKKESKNNIKYKIYPDVQCNQTDI
ncbi:MAG: GGDEF domain-containing protein [Spirochaetes bacterium]|nr:GGDEF domain-containing protein [Spirochaetota bacterium]